MNSFDGRTKADAAIVPAGQSSSVSVYVTNTANVILDINGYFTTPGSATLAFFSLPQPCRIVDTRGANGPLGGPILSNGQVAGFSASTVELQHTVGGASVLAQFHRASEESAAPELLDGVAGGLAATRGFHPELFHRSNDCQRCYRSGGNRTANRRLPVRQRHESAHRYHRLFCAALVAGNSAFAVHLQSLPSAGHTTGRWRLQRTDRYQRSRSPCEVTGTAKGYVLNATVLPSGALGYLTLWPDGQGQPTVSTLNAPDGAVTSNMAIVPTQQRFDRRLCLGIDAVAAGHLQLLRSVERSTSVEAPAQLNREPAPPR